MKELDRKIREALVAEDEELIERFQGEQSMLELVSDTFRGKHRWLVGVVFISTLAFVVLGVFSAVQFFQAVEVRDMIMWTGAFVFCLVAVLANKTWYWLELNKNTVTREVKRVELQISRLAERLIEVEESRA